MNSTSKAKTKEHVWHTIGNVVIDTATLMVCDPCNADEGEGSDLAVFVDTGLGDGNYPVSVRYEDVQGFGKRVAEVRITFLPHPALDLDVLAH
jgi:hypothetical protein